MKHVSDFVKGDLVNVEADGEYVPYDFTGRVVGHRLDEWVQVKDQNDDVFDCLPEQLSFSSDGEMHD